MWPLIKCRETTSFHLTVTMTVNLTPLTLHWHFFPLSSFPFKRREDVERDVKLKRSAKWLWGENEAAASSFLSESRFSFLSPFNFYIKGQKRKIARIQEWEEHKLERERESRWQNRQAFNDKRNEQHMNWQKRLFHFVKKKQKEERKATQSTPWKDINFSTSTLPLPPFPVRQRIDDSRENKALEDKIKYDVSRVVLTDEESMRIMSMHQEGIQGAKTSNLHSCVSTSSAFVIPFFVIPCRSSCRHRNHEWV